MLNYANLTKDLGSVQKPLYNPRSVTAGIVHFGVGNFFRAHQAYYLDRLLKDDPYWGVIGVGLRDSASAREKSDLFRKQNGIYSLTECASDGSFKTRLIGVLLHYILAPQNPQAVLKALISPETHLVSMTLTEGGYPYDARAQKVIEDDAALNADLKNLEKPQTAFGYIVAGCALRRKLKGCGFTVLSCDNLQQNGTTTKKIVLYLARAHDPDLAKWIEENVTFPNAMVDRITPSITAETQRLLNEKTGLNDALPVLTEDFTQWVIEDNFLHTRPEFEKVGAQIVGDVSPYEHVKTRMLNASHGMLCYSACLLGYEIKDEALRAEPLLRRLLWDFWNDDVIPTLTPPEGLSLEAYRDNLLKRYLNPAIGDQTLRVAGDGASKIPVFWGPTVKAIIQKKGDISRIAYGLAAYLEMLQGVNEKGTKFTPKEPSFTNEDWACARSSNVEKALSLPAFRAWQDIAHDELNAQIVKYRQMIKRDGVRATLEKLVKAPDPV